MFYFIEFVFVNDCNGTTECLRVFDFIAENGKGKCKN